ncbi:SDR family oxidoreductase, partial [bacterium]|nr:SDR family oxidoreductase [bacterium]
LTRDASGVAADTARGIAALGVRAAVVAGDLQSAETPSRVVDEAREVLGGLDILVNNAAIFERDCLAELDLDAWSRTQRINLRAPLLLSRAFAAALPPDREGDIINVNDIHALRPREGYFSYTHSKASLHVLTRNLAAALAPRIRVNEIALGAVLPPVDPPDGYAHTNRDALPLGRFPAPDDAADALEFLLGCRAVTGQTILIDGGEHLADIP